MNTIYDFRGIGPKRCGVQMVASQYLNNLLAIGSSSDIFLFNSSVKSEIQKLNTNNKYNFVYSRISRFNLLDGLILLLRFGANKKLVSFHSSLPILYFSQSPKYFICHDLFVITDKHFFDKYYLPLRIAARLYFYFLLLVSFKIANKIIVPSEYVQRSIIEKFPEFKNKILVNYNPIDRIQLCKSPFSIKRGKIRLLFIGNLRSYKGFSDLLPHFRNLDMLKYELVVLTSDTMYKTISGIPNLHVFYKTDDDVKNHFIKNCDILLIPSRFEGFGLPVLEGVLNTCRILLSDSSSFDHFDFLKLPRFNFANGDNFELSLVKCLLEDNKVLDERALMANKIFDNSKIFKKFSLIISEYEK